MVLERQTRTRALELSKVPVFLLSLKACDLSIFFKSIKLVQSVFSSGLCRICASLDSAVILYGRVSSRTLRFLKTHYSEEVAGSGISQRLLNLSESALPRMMRLMELKSMLFCGQVSEERTPKCCEVMVTFSLWDGMGLKSASPEPQRILPTKPK